MFYPQIPSFPIRYTKALEHWNYKPKPLLDFFFVWQYSTQLAKLKTLHTVYRTSWDMVKQYFSGYFCAYARPENTLQLFLFPMGNVFVR